MFVLAIVVASLGILIYFAFFYQSRAVRMLSKVPGPYTLPILGNALDFNVSNELLFRMDILGITMRPGMDVTWLMNRPFVSITRAKYVEKILTSNTHIDKSEDYDYIMPWLGTGLLTSKGQKWFHRRKLLTPTFHFKILEDFLDIMNEQSVELVSILGREFKDGQVFDMFGYITRCALDIICETAMGKKVNAQQQRDTDYIKALYSIANIVPGYFRIFFWKLSPSGREEKTLLRILHGFTESVIKEKKTEFLSKRTTRDSQEQQEKEKNEESQDVYMKRKQRVAFLNLLLTAQAENPENYLSDMDIREEVDTFMFEGHDTTAANLNWTVFLLGCHPEYQVKVYEELYSIFGEDKERPVTNEDMTKMKYLECCIKESLRLYPSVPIIARAINTDFPIDEETTIPAGSTAYIVPFALHRDPKVFPEPEVFLPDRFFPENSVDRNPFAYVPFSGGARNCIGQKFAIMEEKVILANIFRNFKVEAAERREDLVLLAELVMRPKNGLRIKLTKRT